jgi:hypothetical protein
MIFAKKKQLPLTPFEALKTFQVSLDHLIGETLNHRISRRELADSLDCASQGLRINDALTRPVL